MSGRIGPNAVIRVEEAVAAIEGAGAALRIFQGAGIAKWLERRPTEMVDETRVAALHRSLHGVLGDGRARTIGWIAGQRTADYLLANRIPRAAQTVLKGLPPRLAAPILTRAIARNAWTFVGSGQLDVEGGRPIVISVKDCPLCKGVSSAAPYCDFYGGTFERLFTRLVNPGSRAREIACQATGGGACAFSLDW